MRENPYDLFGEVIVTHHDIALWLIAVPAIDPQSPRAARYVASWDVVGKITRAKSEGLFWSIVERPARPITAWFGQRFGLPTF
jgi:hypothetical protein